jgi:aminopeptidase N
MRYVLPIAVLSCLWAQQDAATRALLLKYDARFWHLDLEVSHLSLTLKGYARTQLTVTATSLDTLAFELHSALTVDSVRVGGVRRSFLRRGHTIRIPLNPQPPQGTLVEAEVFYRGTPPSTGATGIFNRASPTWGNQVTWTLTQPFYAHTWWPCKQILTDKADSVWVFLTVPAGTKAGSNGLLEGVDTLSDGRLRYRWKSRYPIAYYLVAFAVAEYIDYSFYAPIPGLSQPVLVQNYIYNNPGTLPQFQAQIDTTAALLREFSKLFGPYPFHEEKYGHMMAPFSGGMEHQTMTTQGFFTFTLTAHELAHQWFGDYVTCASWQDVWLNEGFASYSEYLALQKLGTASAARNWLVSTHDNIISSPCGSVWVPDTLNDSRIFSSRLSYDKGAYLLHMLRYRVRNDSLFFAALRAYLQNQAYGVALAGNFRQTFENATGLSLGTFFQQYYYGQGHPRFAVRWNNAGPDLWVEITQQASCPSQTPFFETPIPIYLQRTSAPDTTIHLFLTQSPQTFYIPNAGTITNLQVDPDYWLIREILSITRDVSLGLPEAATPALRLFPNPLPQGQTLYLEAPAAMQVSFTDASGRLIYQTALQPGINPLTPPLSPGFYLVTGDRLPHTQPLRLLIQ